MQRIKRVIVRSLLATVIAVLTVEVIPAYATIALQHRSWDSLNAFYAAQVGADLAAQSEAVTHDFNADGLSVPGDYHGEYVNVEGGIRRTVGQPQHPARTVWMFGNSALYGDHVKDSDTIASKLQALMPADRVVNMAWGAYTIAMQTERLKVSAIEPGDDVIFYDGPYDISLMFAQPPVCLSQMGVIQLACLWIPKRFDLALAAERMAQMTQALHDARAYTEAHGGTFYHFWQPVVFSHDLTPAEQSRLDAFNAASGQALRADSGWRIEPPDGTISLFHILEGQPSAYTDWIHTTRAANAVIAGAIRARVGA